MGHNALMMMFRAILVFLFALLLPLQAMAQSAGLSVVRDSEIEFALREWCTPIWQAAGLNPDAIKIILVNSPDVNAFVAGGSNIFIYTGLINATRSPGELLGVIAHETGHIAGGHLIQGRQAMERASYESILATMLGIGAAASGAGDAAKALVIGGNGLAMSGFLAHTRVQEASADQAALSYLEKAPYNPTGLVSFLNTMKNQELLPQSQQDQYLRTHPLTSDRLDAMISGSRKSKNLALPYSTDMVERYMRIKAKISGFMTPQRVVWDYSEKDTSTSAIYARAIAAYRQSDKAKAIKLIDQLIAQEKDNPWFYEVKGQMLRDFGDLQGALTAYRKTVALEPKSALTRIDLAQVLIEMPGGPSKENYAEAEKNLDLARQLEQKSMAIHRMYATMYGRMGDEPQAKYHLAEEATLRGDTKEARRLLEAAMPGLKAGTPALRQANDLKVYLDAQPKKDDSDRH